MYILKNKKYLFFVKLIDWAGFKIKPLLRIKDKGFISQGTKKILIVRLDHIGDLVMSLPAIIELKRWLPDSQIDILTSPWGREIFSGSKDINNIFILKSSWFQREGKRYFSLAEIIPLIFRLRRNKYDCCIDLRGDFRSILLLYLIGSDFSVGYGITGGSFLLSLPVKYKKDIHEVEKNLGVIYALGCKAKNSCAPRLYISAEEDNRIEERLTKLGIYKNDLLIGIHPVAGYPSKMWACSKMKSLIELLNEIPFPKKIIITGSNGDKAKVKKIIEGLTFKPANLTGETTLRELSALIKRINLFIGYDSGPAHIAEAVNTASVIIFSGTNNYKQWAPCGKNRLIIRRDVSCSPCELPNCPIHGHPCMELIEVEDVISAVKNKISAFGG